MVFVLEGHLHGERAEHAGGSSGLHAWLAAHEHSHRAWSQGRDTPATARPPCTSSSTGAPIYRTTTTRRGLIFPEKTTIEYIGSQDTEKHRVVAEIIWRWPSQKRSYVHIGGNLYSLDEFLMLGPGFAK